jgi:predicted nuclease of predicted toxin-antitoxin system
VRFLVDECTGPAVAAWLRGAGHDVFSVYDDARGDSDDAILQRAVTEDRIVITNDKDFGDKVIRDGWQHRGIVLMRLVNVFVHSPTAGAA